MGLDLLLGDLGSVDGDLNGAVLRQGDLRADVHLGGEHQRGAVGERADVDLGLREDVDLLLAHRVGVEPGQCAVDGLLQDRPPAEALVEDARRHLARPEAGNPDVPREFAVGGVDRGLELVEGHLDGQLDPGGTKGFLGGLHGAANS